MKRRSRQRKAAGRSRAKKSTARARKASSTRHKASRKAVRRSSRKPKHSRTLKSSSRKKVSRSSRSSKTARRRASFPSSGKKSSQSMMFEPLEQVTVACVNCGRQFNIVKLHGLSTEGMICQRCNIGEVEFPEG